MNQETMNNYLDMMNSSGLQPNTRQRQMSNEAVSPAENRSYVNNANERASNRVSDVSASDAIKMHEPEQNVEELDRQETMSGNMYGNAQGADMSHGNTSHTMSDSNVSGNAMGNAMSNPSGNGMANSSENHMGSIAENYRVGRTAESMYGNKKGYTMGANDNAHTGNSCHNSNMVSMNMKEALAKNIGEYVVVEFMACEDRLVKKQGILYNVGCDFITLYDDSIKTYTLCYYCDIKFVTYYQSGQRPNRAQPARK